MEIGVEDPEIITIEPIESPVPGKENPAPKEPERERPPVEEPVPA